jgi:DNA adenine methylase
MLRYAGGKQRAIKQLETYLPDGTTEVASPFTGGGSFEMHLAHKGIKVFCNDVYEPLINYFKHQHECLPLVRTYLPITKDAYLTTKKTMGDGTDIERAAKFFVVNRSCFSGCMSGGFSGARFTESCIKQLDLTNIEFSSGDYETFLASHPGTFAYLDPPYDQPNLYLSAPFDHERLARTLKGRTNWFMSYNDTPRIRELYADCEIENVEWAWSMNAKKKSSEIIIRPADRKENQRH